MPQETFRNSEGLATVCDSPTFDATLSGLREIYSGDDDPGFQSKPWAEISERFQRYSIRSSRPIILKLPHARRRLELHRTVVRTPEPQHREVLHVVLVDAPRRFRSLSRQGVERSKHGAGVVVDGGNRRQLGGLHYAESVG